MGDASIEEQDVKGKHVNVHLYVPYLRCLSRPCGQHLEGKKLPCGLIYRYDLAIYDKVAQLVLFALHVYPYVLDQVLVCLCYVF